MKSFNRFVLLIGIGALLGCQWINPKNPDPISATQFVQTGKVVRSERLSSGGSIYISPFSAGVNVVANEELDKTALMFIKGLADLLEESKKDSRAEYHTQAKKFNLVFAENKSSADYIVEGRFTKLNEPSKFKKWVLGKNKYEVALEGRLTDKETGEVILFFSDSRSSKKPKIDNRQLSHMLGRDIGNFILSGVK